MGKLEKFSIKLLVAIALIAIPNSFFAVPPAKPLPQPNISVVGYFSSDKVQRGGAVRVAMVIDIPSGYHINSSRPLENYLIPTQLKVDAPGSVHVGAVTYPAPVMRKFKFSEKQLSVYENHVVLRFTVAVPANYSGGSVEVKANVRLQSCNDEACFPPKNYNQNMHIDVV